MRFGYQLETRGRIILKVALGLISACLAALLQWVFWPWVGPSRFIIFYPSVIFASLLGGLWAGLAATLVSAVAAVYLFFPPVFSLAVHETRELSAVAVYLVSAAAITIINEVLRKRQMQLKVSEELRKMEQEKLHLVDSLVVERKRLQEALQTRDEFLSVASHELKTPLTTLKLQVQLRKRFLLRHESDFFRPERLRAMFDSDEDQFDRLNRLIDDMLDVSSINSGRLSVRKEPVDLCRLAREVVERYADVCRQAGCKVALDARDSLVGEWDRSRLDQVISNLLTNAIKYGNRSPIEVSIRRAGESAELIVRDRGRGIPKVDQERIFGRFERASRSGAVGGLGLGLYIVRQIVELHGGSVRVESEPGKGAAFVVWLPLAVSNVIVIEDDDAIRETLKTLFEHDGYEVVTAGNGQEALEWILRAKALPGAILLDLMMPVMDGFELIKTLSERRPEVIGEVPIIVITAAPISPDREAILKPAVRALVKKPFAIDEVLALIEQCCH